jgi:serine/threonine protein kinase
LSDFGSTKEGTSKRVIATPNRTGTSSYRAPEIIRRRDPQFNNKVDIWGLGCIMWELIFGSRRFESDWDVDEYAKNPVELTPWWQLESLQYPAHRVLNHILSIMTQIMLSMLKEDGVDRPSAETVSAEIEYCRDLCEQERKIAESQLGVGGQQ